MALRERSSIGSHAPWLRQGARDAVAAGGVTSPAAQAPPSPADGAARALPRGRFDEVDKLLQNATDPRAVALKAPRGGCSAAATRKPRSLLARAATAAPTSDAALELGLLQLKLGRRDRRDQLNRLADRLADESRAARTAASAALAGAGRAGARRRRIGEPCSRTRRRRCSKRSGSRPTIADIRAASGESVLEVQRSAEAAKYFQAALEARRRLTLPRSSASRTVAWSIRIRRTRARRSSAR